MAAPLPVLLDAFKMGIINKDALGSLAAYKVAQDRLNAFMFQFKQGERMNDSDVALFSVYRAANGFFATTESGKTVIGLSLSDVCRDVLAVLTDEQVQKAPDDFTTHWQQV